MSDRISSVGEIDAAIEWQSNVESTAAPSCFDRQISLDLKMPINEKVQSTSTITGTTITASIPLQLRCRQLWIPLTAWSMSLVSTIVYSLFIYQILILSNPKIGRWIFDASLTNLLLSIFSQLYAMVLIFMLHGLLDTMRWTLASRGGKTGTSVSSFFQLSPGTNWFSVLRLMWVSKMRNIWGICRLMLPFIGLGFGSILKFQNTFEYDFISNGPSINVFAGTVPPDISTLNLIPASYMAGYFDIWSQQLTTYPRFSVPWPMKDCGDNCTSYFLPGGIEIARKVDRYLNSTLLQGGIFNVVDSISVQNASGLAARFASLDPGFEFDVDSECSAYINPYAVSDGMQMCIRQVNDSIAAGWRACPSSVQFKKLCNETSLWTRTPLETTTLLTVYRQYAKTIYDREDLSIKQVKATTEAEIVHIFGNETRQIWDRIFVPDDNASEIDDQSINVTISRLAWKYRTYKEFFPDNDSPVEHLRNFLSVPLQFAVTAMQFANYTLNDQDLGLFPPDLITVATGGRSIQKFVGQLWTSWVFISSGIAIVVLSGCAFTWIITQNHLVPSQSGIIELDFASRVMSSNNNHSGGSVSSLESFRDLSADISSKPSGSGMQALRGWRVQMAGATDTGISDLKSGYSSAVIFIPAGATRSDSD